MLDGELNLLGKLSQRDNGNDHNIMCNTFHSSLLLTITDMDILINKYIYEMGYFSKMASFNFEIDLSLKED